MNDTNAVLTKANFDRLRTLIYKECGIHLGEDKKTMMEVRLKRRLRRLDLTSLSEYCERVFSAHGKTELVHLIDVITTNKTDFFREAEHFDFLVSRVLPELASRKGTARHSLVWSAGCSTGEEPYTLAMVLSEYAQQVSGFRFSVLATDICSTALEHAVTGIFKSEVVTPVPQEFRKKYFMRSRERGSDLLRVVPEIRELVEFRRLNFMDADFGLSEAPEIIFCRNVIIYFDRPTQVRFLTRLAHQLAPGGYFFAGHSESFQGMNLPLIPVAPAVYRNSR